MQVENQRLLDVDPVRHDPARLLPINALYQLTIRPIVNFEAAVHARLTAVPTYLKAAQDFLAARAVSVPAVWLRSTVTEARAGAFFVSALPQHPKVRSRADLETPVALAVRALHEYADFLERELAPRAAGNFACGSAHFEMLLRERHFLDVSIDTLRAFGEDLVARTRTALREACRDGFGTDEPRAVFARLQTGHPAATELLAAYRRAMESARDFVHSRRLVSLPATEHLEVIETPLFLRHQIPFAAYCEPAPNDPRQQGCYYVTPPQTEEELAEHDHIGLRHTCVHEAWPGHHLQFVTANLNPAARTLPRLLNASATLYEGWALYSEQLMQEEGFLGVPESRVLLRDRLWRALRILIDIDIHTRGVGLEAAAGRLVSELGFPRSQARAELTWYSRAPTAPLGYATGWALINALREQERGRRASLSLTEFHDRLLSAGSIALPLVIQRTFGEPAWQEARKRVFGGTA